MYRGEAKQGKASVALFSAERASHGGPTLGHQTRQNCIVQKGEPWPCRRIRVSSGLKVRSGLRSFERLTRDGKAGLYAKQDAKRKVRTTLYGGMGWVKTEGLNAQTREALGRCPNKAGVRRVGTNGAWMRSAAGVALQAFTACLEKCIPCPTGVT